MDSSFTIKPRPGVSPRANVSRDPVTVRETVDTEIDPAKAVAATTDGSPPPAGLQRAGGDPASTTEK